MKPRILALGAHNDDCEAGIGGISALLHQQGCEQLYINFACMWHKADLTDEQKAEWAQQEIDAARILGAEKRVMGSRDGGFFEPSTALIRELAAAIVEFDPQIAFLQWPLDNHAEHRMAADVAYKALCLAHVEGSHIREIYAYESSLWQTGRYFSPDIHIDVSSVMDVWEKSERTFAQNTANGDHLWKCDRLQSEARGLACGFPAALPLKIVKLPDGNDDFLLRQLLGDKFRWAGNGMYPAFGQPYFNG